MEAEQVELDAQLPVVALLSLLAPPQVLVQLRLRLPDRAVDPLEHRPLLVAAPVRPRDRQQLERADPAGGLDVRPLAQVTERPVLVERHRRHRLARVRRPAGQVVQDLDLERLAIAFLDRATLVERDLPADEGVVGRHAGAHPSLDRLEVVGGERARQLEVVVEAIVDRRADAQAGAGEQVQHGLGHDVRRAVAHGVDGRVGAGIEQLVRRAASRRLERELLLVRLGVLRLLLIVCHVACSRESRNLSPDRTRGSTSRGSTRLHVARQSAANVRSCRANGRIPGRFAGRSRVVPQPVESVGASSRWPRLSGDIPAGVSRSTRCSCQPVGELTRRREWWAILDSNQ